MKVTNANGVKACLIYCSDGEYRIRVYDRNHEFKDYDILHHDLCFEIQDEDAYFYEDGKRAEIDHAPTEPVAICDESPDLSENVKEAFGGMSHRDYLAAHAPIDFATAAKIWGYDHVDLVPGDNLRAFFAVWAYARYAYADAMLHEKEKLEKEKKE